MRLAIAIVMTVFGCAAKPADRVDHPRPTTNVGTGHPYWKQLSRDARASLGKVSQPTVCVVIAADGTIHETKVVPDAKSDDAIAHALRAFADARNAKKLPVPAELRPALDGGWMCMPLVEPEEEPLSSS